VLYTATIKGPQGEVRSGPSDDPKMYPTNRLRQGEVVEVVGERKDGWLEIKPPQESFSWVNQRFLEKLSDTMWMVRTHDDTPVDVLVGSRVADEGQRPTIIGARLKRGAQVASFWNAKVADDGVWLPIVPPPSEVRYIKAAAVAKVGAAPEVAVAPSGGGAGRPDATVSWNGTGVGGPAGPPAVAPPPASVPAPPLAPVAHPKWAQAEQFEKAGNKVEAERMYRELGNEVCNKNHDLAMRCYNRAEFLRRGAGASVPSGYQPNRPAVASSVSGYEVRLPVPTRRATRWLRACQRHTPRPLRRGELPRRSAAKAVAARRAVSAGSELPATASVTGGRMSGSNRRTQSAAVRDGRPGVNLERMSGRMSGVRRDRFPR
jgi:hypothetical protein